MKKYIAALIFAASIAPALYGQSLTTVVLPQFIEGINGTNSTRIPFTYRARITGLLSNTTYRYFNQIVRSSDAATSNGAGNAIYAPTTGDFVRTTSPGLSNAGAYGIFTTDGTGAYEGWFITEPTGSARFTPGTYLFMRIMFNDGANGTSVVLRLTTTDSVRVVKLDPAALDSTGTGLRCTSSGSPKDFVFLYDDTSGAGRPLSGSFIESDGTANTAANSYAAFYSDSVNGVNGAFGLVLPNILPAGVRRIEQRSLATGAVTTYATDLDGLWPSGAQTVNPGGGATAIVLAGTDLITYSLTVSTTNGTVTRVPDLPVYQYGANVQLTAVADSSYHFVTWSGDVPAGHESDNPLTVTMTLNRSITATFALTTATPTLILPTSASISSTTAVLGATVVSDGNSPISERGVVWSTLIDPTTADHKVSTTDTSRVYTVVADTLLVGTLIHFRGYAINGVGTGYTPDATFYTLSAEPSAHAGSFSARAISASRIDLSWSHATGATGYIILLRKGSDPTGVPLDATGYAVGDTIGDGTVGALILSDTITSASIAGLAANSPYHFSILDFAWDGSHASTYNYKTDGSIPTAGATTLAGPQLVDVILPQYIQGVNGTNSDRIPFAYRARLTGLLANATYRFANQVVLSSEADSVDGSGNCIFVSQTGDFVRTSNPDLSVMGAYGTFTTDSTRSYEGWFVTEPTGNKRFVPGTYVFMRLWLNDGGGGSTETTWLTTADSVRVVKLDPAASDSTGTGLRCTSPADAKDFVFLYDNVAGTGRPISGSFIESDGTDNSVTNKYAAFYGSSVDGVAGAFGVVLPNLLSNGVRRIERRSLASGAHVAAVTDADGVWPSGANTVNPSGGRTEIVIAGTDVGGLVGVQADRSIPREFALLQNYPNPFNPTTIIEYSIPVETYNRTSLRVYDILGREVAVLVNERKAPGKYAVQFDASSLSSGVYFYRIQAGNFVQTRKLVLVR